ncbi:MAG: hypothetical protein ACWGNI_00435 [Desulfobacterales bacterium]
MVLPTITEPYEIPKKILQAEKMLKITYPEIYSKIHQYRDSRNIDFFEWEKIKFKIERQANFNIIKSMILAFIGLKDEPVLEDESEEEKIILEKTEKRCNNKSCIDPSPFFMKKHSYRKSSK